MTQIVPVGAWLAGTVDQMRNVTEYWPLPL